MNVLKVTLATIIFFAIFSFGASAQNIAINATGCIPDTSAMLDVSSTTKGILIPRLTTAQIAAIPYPATGLIVYNTSLNALEINTGTSLSPIWPLVTTTSSGWSSTGNAGTSYTTNFLGTTDNVSLRTRTNNLQRMIVDSLGNVGIGLSPAFTTANREKFLVDAGSTSSVNPIAARGNIDSYLQFNIQNQSTGVNASSDIVATADNGDETANYVDMGINGSNYSGGVMGSTNDAYLQHRK